MLFHLWHCVNQILLDARTIIWITFNSPTKILRLHSDGESFRENKKNVLCLHDKNQHYHFWILNTPKRKASFSSLSMILDNFQQWTFFKATNYIHQIFNDSLTLLFRRKENIFSHTHQQQNGLVAFCIPNNGHCFMVPK